MSEFADAMAEHLRQRALAEAEPRTRTERVAALRKQALVTLHRQLSRLVQTINLKAGAAGTLSLDPVELPLWLSGHDQATLTLHRQQDSVYLQVDAADQGREPDPGVLATARLRVIKPLLSTTAFVRTWRWWSGSRASHPAGSNGSRTGRGDRFPMPSRSGGSARCFSKSRSPGLPPCPPPPRRRPR